LTFWTSPISVWDETKGTNKALTQMGFGPYLLTLDKPKVTINYI